jgi:hypothetical protein
MAQWSAWMRYYFHIDPDQLSIGEWAKRKVELSYCLKALDIIKNV